MSIFQLFKFLFLLQCILPFSVVANELLQQAMDGEPEAQYQYAFIIGDSDATKSRHLIEIAAFQNHLKSQQYYLAHIADNDFHAQLFKNNIKKYQTIFEKEFTKGDLNQLRKIGNDGDIETQYFLWLLYVNNLGVSKAEAYTWLKQAAGNLHPEATFSLGLLYYYGYIVPQELPKAKKLILNSQALGSSLARILVENNKFNFEAQINEHD